MTAVEWFALLGLITQLIGMGAGAFWVVGSVRATSNQLAGAVESLNKTLDKLEKTMKEVEVKQVDHEIRMRLVEEKQKCPREIKIHEQ
jgi:hypothetical protein